MKKPQYIPLLVLASLLCLARPLFAQTVDEEEDSVVMLRILIAYTPAAFDSLGGMVNASNAIMQAADDMNTALNFSETMVQFDLARMVKVDLVETGDFYDDLFAFAQNAKVNRLRANYSADVVAFIVNDSNMCGLPLILNQVAESNTAFCAVHWECMEKAYGLAHMVGHLFGAGHLASGDADTPDDAVAPYAHGYMWNFLETDVGFITIMGYFDDFDCFEYELPECYVIPRFSNPQVMYSGVPTGVDSICDNARLIYDNRRRLEFIPLNQSLSLSDTVSNADLALLQGRSTAHSGSHYWVKDSAMVWFRAATRITLEPGFKAEEGTYFETILDSAMLDMR